MRNKLFSTTCLSALIIILSLVIVSPFAGAQSGTNENGIITSDAVWTKVGSPYSLTGPVAVNQGVTLTVEPGVTVNLNSYYIQVNGTLIARGTNTDPIHISGGSAINVLDTIEHSGPAGITFYPSSHGWNEQTGSGSIIENAIFSSTQLEVDSSPKIASTTGLILIIAGSPMISDNSQLSIIVFSGNPTITHNNLDSRITVYTGSPVITNNQITCQGDVGIFLGFKYGLLKTDTPYVSGNTITGTFSPAIYVTGAATVQNNLIVGTSDSVGIAVNGGEDGPGDITIQYNTIVGCSYGLEIDKTTGTLTLNHNNFENITNYLVYNKSPNSFSVTNNWWGTTNGPAISQSIYDSKNDFNLGTVNFQPFLTAPDPNAPTPIAPTPTPTQIPTPSPTAPEFPTAATVALIASATMAAVFYTKKLSRSTSLNPIQN